MIALILLAVQLLQMLPAIIKSVIEIEQAFKSLGAPSGTGPAKKGLIMGTLAIAEVDTKMTDRASKIVDLAVTTMNPYGLSKPNSGGVQ